MASWHWSPIWNSLTSVALTHSQSGLDNRRRTILKSLSGASEFCELAWPLARGISPRGAHRRAPELYSSVLSSTQVFLSIKHLFSTTPTTSAHLARSRRPRKHSCDQRPASLTDLTAFISRPSFSTAISLVVLLIAMVFSGHLFLSHYQDNSIIMREQATGHRFQFSADQLRLYSLFN
ncbi:hypothetical protein NUW54_g11946 [Trametes sanguinea]|uniref:Uncharacterized protein n=1 Tax=Trametes sanguinea TaxID=158606 RepID=A0ACC1N534_9APHY|nr:hypothetical protein NUW54_g11946 [Trametes sanguinea]